MTLIATILAASRLYQNWFAHRYSSYVLSTKLAELQNGMSFDLVQSSFSSSTRLQPSDLVDLGPTRSRILHGNSFRYASPSLINMLNDVFKQMAPGDELYKFEDLTGGGAYLQFRSGTLVNHDPTLYVPTLELAQLNGVAFPSIALRFGIVPYFVLLGIIVLCVARLLQRHHHERASPNDPQ